MCASKKHEASADDQYENVPTSSLPAYPNRHPITRAFDTFAATVTRWAGSPIAFGTAVLIVVVWALTGPLFKYSDAWQLIINTGTTVVTFLMVFLIQQSQNKDSVAIHLKLNELVAANRAANDELIGIEDVAEEDLRRIADAYLCLAKRANATRKERLEIERSIAKAKEQPAGSPSKKRER